MRKFFLTIAVLVMPIVANAQTNQYFWYQGNLMMGNPIAQIDSVTFGDGEPVDTVHIMLPRTIVKIIEVHDTTFVHDTIYFHCPNQESILGVFSVSQTVKVRFSPGNLQYKASSNIWRFAENQWDVIGDDNSNISPTYNGWIDLFGWGTSGYNSIYPYTFSSCYECSDYPYQTSDSKNDWGIYNPISNGGNQNGTWRTLQWSEWKYLIEDRPNASSLCGEAIVNGQQGLLILPDDWNCPVGLTWQGLPENYTMYGSTSENLPVNIYDGNDWNKIESTGAIFLPCAGYRTRTTISSIGTYGGYWSFTKKGNYYAYLLSFGKTMIYQGSSFLYMGYSVRLVQDVE